MSDRAPVLTAGRFATRIGEMVGVVDRSGALVYLDFVDKTGPTPPPDASSWRGHRVTWSATALASTAAEIVAYLAGHRRTFEIAVGPMGTPFQQRVWHALREVPYGATISYAELAARAGRPGAARAAGRANATNPVAIVIPCHRVVGSDGALTGYSGGLARKAALLELEAGQLVTARAIPMAKFVG
jgi:methylated-DNA-[protein]-cysteine S-methyltransferase